MQVRRCDQKRLSAESGLPYRTLQNYLSGTNAMPASALAAVCRVLDISADLILFGGPKIDAPALNAAVSSYERLRSEAFSQLSNATLAHLLATLYAEQLHRELFRDELHKGGEAHDELGLWAWDQPGPIGPKP